MKKTLNDWQKTADIYNVYTVLGFVNTIRGHTYLNVRCKKCGYTTAVCASNLVKAGCANCSNRRKKTISEYQTLADIIGEYIVLKFEKPLSSKGTALRVLCKKCKTEAVVRATSIHKYGCIRCARRYHATIDEIKHRLKKERSDFCFNFSKFNYKNMHSHIEYTCNTCGFTGETSLDHIFSGTGCPKCSKVYHRTKDELREDLSKLHPSLVFDFENLIFNTVYDTITYTCKKCKKQSNAIIHDLLGGHGCSRCKASTLEKKVALFLNKNHIYFVEQWRSPLCTFQKKLSFDFYIPSMQLAIECQGVQHFIPTSFSRKQDCFKAFELQTRKDKIKVDFCNKNNIKLIYVIDKKLKKYKNKYEHTIIVDDMQEEWDLIESNFKNLF